MVGELHGTGGVTPRAIPTGRRRGRNLKSIAIYPVANQIATEADEEPALLDPCGSVDSSTIPSFLTQRL